MKNIFSAIALFIMFLIMSVMALDALSNQANTVTKNDYLMEQARRGK
jgi:hypothetical protein